MARGYQNDDPNGDRDTKVILDLGLDLVMRVHDLIEHEGADMIIILCNLKDKLGHAIASRNKEFKPEDGNDLWCFAMEKDAYAELMREHECFEDAKRMKALEKQIVVFSAGMPHYFSLKGRYSGVPKNAHWAQFRRKDFHA